MSRSCERHKHVATALARFVEPGLGAVDPFRDAVFGFIARTRGGLGHNGAGREALLAPCGLDRAGNLAKLVR